MEVPVRVEFHENRTGTPHPPDQSTLLWEGRYHAIPRVGEGVTFPSGRTVVATNVIHVLGQFRSEHHVVVDVANDAADKVASRSGE